MTRTQQTTDTGDEKMIFVQRQDGQDASRVAAVAAKQTGTKTIGNLRWYGASGPAFREINTADGQGVRNVAIITAPSGTTKEQDDDEQERQAGAVRSLWTNLLRAAD